MDTNNYDSACSINAFNAFIPQNISSKRLLQSIAFHLNLEVDLSKLSFIELKSKIGIEIHKKYSFVAGMGRGYTYTLSSDQREVISKICSRDCVDEDHFDFLNKYPSKSIVHKIDGLGIAGPLAIRQAFDRNQSSSVTLGYLFDTSNLNAIKIVNHLKRLQSNLNVMEHQWIHRINWFNDDREKIRAAHHYSGQQVLAKAVRSNTATPGYQSIVIPMPPIADIEDIEIFFHSQKYTVAHKELAFKKIRDLYNTRTSRARSKKHQSNFSLSTEAKSLIEQMARANGITKPAVLEAIFKKENNETLQSLINRNAQNLYESRF